jgi:hypothetical protein
MKGSQRQSRSTVKTSPSNRSDGTRPLYLDEYLKFLLPEFDANQPPTWPPDTFALCMAPLWKSAAYTSVLNHWPPGKVASAKWTEMVTLTAEEWRNGWVSKKVPEEVVLRWQEAFKDASYPLSQLSEKRKNCQLMLELAAIADEASAGLGIPSEGDEESIEEIRFALEGYQRLRITASMGSTLCTLVDPSRARVLPKMHCPQSGLTIRSLSHHLAVLLGDEIKPIWNQWSGLDVDSHLNLLVVPRPSVVNPLQFRQEAPIRDEMSNIDSDYFGFFSVDHLDSCKPTITEIMHLVKAAKGMTGSIHGVVLPELALSDLDYELLRGKLERQNIFLIAGVGTRGSASRHAKNEVRVSFPLYKTAVQHKHHRWKLEERQITQYALGGRLDPEKQWWEHISVDDRTLNFFSLLPWLVLTPLVCEDLARPDPVGDLVRAVGPNLVIALLADGPQLKDRWPARYATTLADDPGCSVLTITSLGMAKLSRPHGVVPPRDPVIALWKDAKSGNPVEIALPDGYDGVVLSLSRRYAEEWSADGRSDGGNSGYPSLTGILPVKL